ncbi:MAG: hypothetical protein ACLP7I_12065 [Limisphaerales bacterium]
MSLFGNSSSSATQSTQTASGTGQIVSGANAQVTNPGSIAVGRNATYTEAGGVSLGNSKNANLGTSYSVAKGGTLSVQNLDPQVVEDALNTVSAVQQTSLQEAAQNQAALQQASDNLNTMLGQPGSTTTPPATATSSLGAYIKWGGAGVLVLVILIWLFHKKK